MRLAMALSWVLAAVSLAQDAAELELEHSLSTDFVTPHTRWAKPYARGRVRVLMFCNGRGTVPREGVELMQRFDVAVEAVFWARIVDSTKQGWHGGEAGLVRMRRLLAKPYDCYFFLGIPPKNLPSEMLYKVLKPVSDGAGVVLAGTDDRRILKPERQLKPLPGFIRGVAGAAAFRVKNGRGVRLPRRPRLDYDVGWQTAYEYWQEGLGRAILWAAGREARGELSLAISKPTLERRSLPAEPATARWRNPGPRPLKLALWLRREDSLRVPLPPIESAQAEGEARLSVPRLRAGAWHLDAIARGDRGIENWATLPFTVSAERTVQAVALERDWGEVGERIRGSVELAGKPLPGERLVVNLRDRRDRILMRKELAKDRGFDFPVEGWLPMLVRVEAVVLDGAGEVSVAHRFFNVVKRHRGQFNFLIWDYPRDTLAPYAEESLARLGTTLQLAGGTPPRVIAAYDIAWVPYTTRILESHTKDGVMKPFCWNDEAKVAAHVKALAEKYRPARQHGVFVYSLGDENHVRGSCLSPQCLAAYRRYLKEAYGTIEALNASWGSQYKSFEEVQLLEPDDNQALEARRRGNYPRWYDRQAFRSHNYVGFCKRFADAYRKIDPKARTGFEGAGRFGRGDDLDLFIRELGFWSPYPGTADEVLRSVAPRDFPRANWMGYRKDPLPLMAKFWRMITRGCDSVWWWRWDGIGRFHGFLAPHLGPYPATRALVEETKIVRDGLGSLLIQSQMLDSGIAILFSHPSCYAGQLEGSYGGVEENHVAWHRAIRELGLQFRYVTDRMLRLGEFDPARFKVLVLSRAEAMGPIEAQVLDNFLRSGGMVIADVRPGIFDGHCKPLLTGCLDEFFGIRQTEHAPAARGRASLEFEGVKASFEGARYDPAVQPTTARAFGTCGGRPAVMVRRVGSGRAILLNFAMASFPRLDEPAAPESAADFLAALFASAGVRPEIRTRSGPRRTRNLETVQWQNGQMRLVALFRHTGEDEDVVVEFDRPLHVVDLRWGKRSGPARSFPTRLLGSCPTFLALSPRKLASLVARLEPETARPGQMVKLRLRVPDALGLHPVKIEAKTPAGKPADWFQRVVMVGGAWVEVPLPVAFNDPVGAWTIEARDLLAERPLALRLTVRVE